MDALQASGAYSAISLDAPRTAAATDQNSGTLGDTLGIEAHDFERAENRATLERLCATLTARERDILRLRFEEDMTQAEIGAVIGVSQMQVSRIIRQTLEHLRTYAENLQHRDATRPAA